MRERDEQTPAHPAPSRFGGTDIFRGALVIITALAIGGFLISRTVDSGDGTATDTDGAATATSATIVDPADPAAPGADGEAVDDVGAAAADPQDAAQTATTAAGQPATSATAGGAEASPDATATTEATQPTTPALRPPSEVKVLVLNGAQIQGIAARGTELLEAASYQTADPKNATAQQSESSILYADGYENEATAVAQAFGPGLEGLIAPLDPAAPPIDDTQGAHVIVVIGANNTIPIS